MERARTLIAMSTFCREWDTSLHFIGTQSDCDQTRADVAELDKDTALAVRFTAALPQSGCPATDRKRRSQTIRTAMNDAIALDPEAIVWVELPLGTDSTLGTYAPTLRSHKACIQNLTAANAPILFAAYRFDGLSDAAARTLMSSSDLVTSAPFAVAFCRDYLNTLQASSVGDVPADLEFLTPPGGTSLRRLMRSENMVTLGQMAAGIAHELGNPLAIISSGLQYLQGKHKGDDDSPDGEFTRMALESVDRMDGMLRTMRDFAASKQNPAIDVDLNTVISEVLTFTAPECRRRGVRFTMLADSTLPPVSMDIIGLKGIVLNLIKNALDAMRERGDTLTVRTRWYPDSSSASVEVENNGPPIPDEVLPNLFRPYYTTKTEGTGLGLYLSKQIAGAHGGDVLGQNIAGSVLFTLVLPAVQTSAGKEWHA
jgi:signal transduction histidine kinase